MKHKLLSRILFLFSLISFTAYAEKIDISKTDLKAKDTISDETIMLPESFNDANIDSLLSSWMISQQTIIDENCMSSDENPYYPEEEYIRRLSEMPTIMEMPYNQIVRSFIDLYTGRRRNLVQYMLGISEFYFPLFEQELDANNMPLELKYLPIIESALNPVAVSRAGATGLWQFMLPTGRIYGLDTNTLIDERRDPVKSTKAAVKYLKDLHDIFQDWNLAIAAYNCGPGNVNKAIKRAGGKTDYWEIYYYLPKETRGYVPAFIAANYIMNYYWAHNICPAIADISFLSDTIQVTNRIHMQQIADVLEVPLDQLRSLNPQYKRDIIPGGEMTDCALRLPISCAHHFITMQDSINNYRSNELMARRTTVEPSEISGREMAKSKTGNIKTYHKVRSGETLSKIARKYSVTINQLKNWNSLKNNNIQTGQRLVVLKG